MGLLISSALKRLISGSHMHQGSIPVVSISLSFSIKPMICCISCRKTFFCWGSILQPGQFTQFLHQFVLLLPLNKYSWFNGWLQGLGRQGFLRWNPVKSRGWAGNKRKFIFAARKKSWTLLSEMYEYEERNCYEWHPSHRFFTPGKLFLVPCGIMWKMQDAYECYFMVADWHSLTTHILIPGGVAWKMWSGIRREYCLRTGSGKKVAFIVVEPCMKRRIVSLFKYDGL